MAGSIIWIGAFLLLVGYFVYRADKKLKEKYKDKFSPHEWDLPGSVAPTTTAAPVADVQSLSPAVARPPVSGYHRQPRWFTAEQAHSYRLLQQALAGEYVLLAKIHLADLVTAPAIFEARLQRRVDFVVCNKQDLNPLCLVELDDAQVNNPETRQLEEICRSVQLPLVTLAADNPPAIPALRQQLLAAMGVVDVTSADERKSCPLCQAPMRKRSVTSGAQAGRTLWVCSTYPACKGWVAIS